MRSVKYFNSETGCHTKVNEPYCVPIAGGRIFEFRLSIRVLVLCGMQTDFGFELTMSCPFPMMVAITPQAIYLS